ncbi:MAG: FKBP-type peptidyl-prolyl cis-trans isomerase [Chitinophagaceae bacterium]|nr:MAG: FKBP-type peptidyl-prolyl cis-trans isomerase [Chitinophagaceae bacterium]
MAQAPAKPKAPAGKPAVKPAAKPGTAAGPVLKTLNDSASYAIGVSVASFYQQQGIKSLNTALITRAINDVLGNKTKLIDETEANAVMNKVMSRMQEDKSKPAIDSGIAFLARNKKRPEVKTTASGLQYEVLRQGDGVRPAAADTFVAHYRGTLLDGTEFDASYPRGEPLKMPLRQVIPGWIEGVQLMPVGSKYKFFIPYTLAYGAFDNGPIPGGSTLIFEIELLDVKKTVATESPVPKAE